MEKAPFFSLSNVRKEFLTQRGERVVALDAVTFEAAAGNLTCIVGPTGSGKSTLLRLVAGLETPDSGTVRVDGAAPVPSQGMGYLTQEHSLFPWLRVKDNIGLPFDVQGTIREEKDKQIAGISAALGIAEALERYPYELSGGMQRRTSFGRLIASGARCWLMDEPFSALDDRTAHQLQRLLLKIVSECGITVLFVTHSIDEAVFLADRIIVLSAGPGRVVDIYDINIEHPRNRLSSEFGQFLEAIRCRIESVIDETG